MSLKAFFKDSKNLLFLGLMLVMLACGTKNQANGQSHPEKEASEVLDLQKTTNRILVGAARMDAYLNFLKGKKIAVVANQSSLVFQTHLVDTLLALDVSLVRVFAPEHGFRGNADAGAHIKDGKDERTGLEIVSLYGKNKKPSPAQLEGIDLMLFDLQDVGARFYTYISSLHYVMEACAENEIPLMVLDRPNPNGHYTDGPVLDPKFSSFVGMHPIPVVHGMTIGEYAQMINGEGWLSNQQQCTLSVISCENYKHSDPYNLPVRPSPNLPNAQAVNLYPSLCFFEGTPVSVGRGTDFPFQVYGSPEWDAETFAFTPKPSFGAKNPKHNGSICKGEDLRTMEKLSKIQLEWLIAAYHKSDSSNFFKPFFNLLAGTDQLKKQIQEGMSASEIRETWQEDLKAFKKMRQEYLIYP